MGRLNYTTEKTNELLEKVDDMPEEVKDGKTPVLETGTTTTLAPGQNATSEVVANGTDSAGNPKYKLNFGIPKGYDGAGGSGGGGVADSVQWANVLNKPSWVNSSTKPAYTASEVGALPANTQIPSKTSQLTNDSGFTTSASFKTINGQSIVGSGNIVIESGGGGGDTPSAGGGNVNVTNGSALLSANYYAFKPSADGSLNGTFSVIPNADENRAGLMSSDAYSKLNDIKQVWKIPIAVLELTDNSTSDEIVTAFGLEANILSIYIAYFSSALIKDSNTEYLSDFPKCFIGNIECLLSGNVTESAYTLNFNYVYSGKLKTISITYTANAEKLSCKLSELGGGGGTDDVYWLPYNMFSLTENSTKEEIFTMFGGEEEFKSLWKTNRNKKFYIPYATGNSINVENYSMSAPACVRATLPFAYQLDIVSFIPIDVLSQKIAIKELTIIFSIGYKDIAGFYNKTIYPNGYELKPEVYMLTSSSTSDDVSTAVDGESGLKKIIQAAKDGNRLVIRGTDDSMSGLQINQDLMCSLYKEDDNGDMQLILSGIGYGLFGGIAGSLIISYTKSSNTFSCNYVSIS